MGALSIPKGKRGDEINGYDPVKPGKYHCIITNVETKQTQAGKNYDLLTLEVLNGDTPGQEGKMLRQSLWCDEKTNQEGEAHIRWAWAAGILHENQTIDFRPDMLGGCQVIIQVVQTERNGKTYTEIGNRGYDVWPLDHPETQGVPRGNVAKPYSAGDSAFQDLNI